MTIQGGGAPDTFWGFEKERYGADAEPGRLGLSRRQAGGEAEARRRNAIPIVEYRVAEEYVCCRTSLLEGR